MGKRTIVSVAPIHKEVVVFARFLKSLVLLLVLSLLPVIATATQ
jgi:hypothetical protein